jgi:hypothetical protein
MLGSTWQIVPDHGGGDRNQMLGINMIAGATLP